MPSRQKINSLMVIGVAAAFQWFFMFTKHDPALRPMIPFGDDPYDALGSIAAIVDVLLCLLLLWRAFRPLRGQTASPIQIRLLERTQAAIPLSILVTLAADAIALARHPHMWISAPARDKLLAVLLAMTAVAGASLWLILRSRARSYSGMRRDARTVSLVAALFLLILATYPEHWIDRFSTHVLTILIGDLLLFAPVSVFLRFFFPDEESLDESHAPKRGNSVYIWASATLFALMVGACLFVAEMSEGGGSVPPVRVRLLVASAYIGLTLAGVLIAVAFLKRPLGLGRSTS